MKHIAERILRRASRILHHAGFEIHRAKPAFVPFVRRYEFTGYPFDFWIANPDATWWYREDEWKAKGEFKELVRLVKSGDRVLEIGSHHGFTGLVCATIVGSNGSVVGLEAHPWNTLVGAAQIGLNPSIRNLRFINAAGADRESKVRISAQHNSSVGGGDSTIEVPSRTGDALDKEFGPFNVLKIDVEGFEVMVLRGCREILRRRPKLAIEVHLDLLQSYGSSVAEMFEILNINDYEGNMVIRPDNESIRPFVPRQMPAVGIANIFLNPR